MAARHDSGRLDSANAYDRACRSTAEPTTRRTGQPAKAGQGTLRERFRNADRPWLLFAGLSISVVGVLAMTIAINGLSPRNSAQPIPIPEPSPRDPPAGQEVPSEPKPGEPKEPIPRPPAREPGAENRGLIQNGAFTGSITPWQVSPGAQVSLENNQLRVDVPAGAADDGSRVGQIASNSFSLRPAQTYTLRFEASATVPAEIGAIVQSQGRTTTTMLSQITGLNTSPQSFVFGFTAPVNTAPPAVLRFRFTSEDERSSATLDNVSITPA